MTTPCFLLATFLEHLKRRVANGCGVDGATLFKSYIVAVVTAPVGTDSLTPFV